MKRTIYFLFALLLSVMLPSCGGSGGGASSAGAITAFALAGVTGTINETGKAIAVTMPFGTDTAALVATFTTTPDPGWFEYFAVRDLSRIFVQYSYGDQEYYDLALDPYQMTNTVATVDPPVVQELNSRLPALKACVGATCRAEESRP